MSIPAQQNTNPTVVNIKVSLNKDKAIPKVLKIHAKINTFYLPIISLKTPKTKAISPPNIIKTP